MIVSIVMLMCLGYDNGKGGEAQALMDKCELQIRHGYNTSSIELCENKAEVAANKMVKRREIGDTKVIDSYAKGMCMSRESASKVEFPMRTFIEGKGGTLKFSEVEL